jgi:hypothetical protein
MPDFIPLGQTPQQTPNVGFYDPQALAQLQADQMQLEQKQKLAQALMGGNYVPNSGRAGALTSILGSVVGAFQQRRNNESVTDILKRKFDAENQASTAKHRQDMEDEQRKFSQELMKLQLGEKYKKDYAPAQFQAAGTFDPSTGSYTPNAAAAQQQIGIKAGEAEATARANARYRAGPADPFSEIKAALSAGVITPDQAKAAMASKATGGAAGALPIASDGVNGDDFLKQLEPTQAAQIKALADGRMAFPTGTALKSTYWQSMLQGVAQYDPSFEAANYGARAATRKDFTSGKAAQTVNALNTVSGHLGDLSDAAEKLSNFGGALTPLNTVKNWASSASGDPRVKQFEANRKAAVDELTRVYRGTGGSEADIKTWADALNTSDSPEQLQGTIGKISELLNSKVSALGDQYKQGMGTIAGQSDFISPAARSALERIAKRSGLNVAPPSQQGQMSDADLLRKYGGL